jgi:hypothetical protein
MPLKRGCFHQATLKDRPDMKDGLYLTCFSHTHPFPDAEFHSIHSKGASTCLFQKNRFISIFQ